MSVKFLWTFRVGMKYRKKNMLIARPPQQAGKVCLVMASQLSSFGYLWVLASIELVVVGVIYI